MYKEINAVFRFINTTFKELFCKAILAIDNDSSGGSKQRELKTFWNGPTNLDTTKNICDSWEDVKILTPVRV